MLEAGFKQKEVAEATAAAWQMSHDIMARGVTENLTLVQSLSNQLGEFHGKDRAVKEAISLAPFAAKYETVLKSLGETAKGAGGEFVRYLELSGQLTDPRSKAMLPASDIAKKYQLGEAIAAAQRGEGTTVTAHDLLMWVQQGRDAAMMVSQSERGILEAIPSIAAMKSGSGGSRAGTGLLMFMKQFMAGSFTAREVEWLKHLDLIDMHKVELKGRGRTAHYIMQPGALQGEDLLKRGLPVDWIWDVLEKAMKAHGLTHQSRIKTTFLLYSAAASAIMAA